MSKEVFMFGRAALVAALISAVAIVLGVIVWLGYSWHGAVQAESQDQREGSAQYTHAGVQAR